MNSGIILTKVKKIKMKTRPYRTLIVLLTLIAIFSFNCLLLAQSPLPKQVDKEKKDFLESQISSANKLFLDQLELNFQYLSKINGHALEILNFLPSITELKYSRFINALRAKTKKIIPELTGRKKPGRNVKRFIKKYLGKENNLQSDFRQLLTSYNEIKKLKTSFKDDFTENLPTAGAYRYYTLCSNALDHSPSDILVQMMTICKDLAKIAKEHEIEKLKRLLPGKILFLEKSYNALEDKLVDRLRHSQSGWGRNMILQIIKLVQQQIIFNKDFSGSVFDKLTSIPTPNNPGLPDLQVISIEITVTDTIKVGGEISIVAGIKNTGQLSTGPSKAKVIFPSGKTEVISIPELQGGQTYFKALRYKIGRAGRNEFTIMANSNFEVWESNTFNNVTKRALILQ